MRKSFSVEVKDVAEWEELIRASEGIYDFSWPGGPPSQFWYPTDLRVERCKMVDFDDARHKVDYDVLMKELKGLG